jgi:alkylation response protein AidB-like acyl-CoA dehydrogenase
MFSLTPTDAQAGLDKQIRELAVERLRPRGLAAERERTLTPDLADELDKLGRQIHGSPEKTDPMSALMACEALAFGDPGIAYAVLPSFQVAHLLRMCGSERQRERLLPLAAEIWSTASSFMYYEGYGRGQTELETEATRSGAGWSISGRKIAVHHPGVANRRHIDRDRKAQRGGLRRGAEADRDRDAVAPGSRIRAAHARRRADRRGRGSGRLRRPVRK